MAASVPLKFTVPDMDCAGCVASITAAVKRIDAHASVTADLETKHVVVGSALAAHEISTAIEDAGYTVKPAGF
jgi:copper chaperone CopZ